MAFIERKITGSILSDGQSILNYVELVAYIDKLHMQLKDTIQAEKAVLIFGCENTLIDAALLLTLLEYQYNFLLVPKHTLQDNTWPGFCQYVLYSENNTAHISEYTGFTETTNFTSPSLLLRTSGSTGTPKLVRHSHSAVRENSQLVADRLQIISQDRIAIPVPLFHMYGLGAAFLPAILKGASINIQNNANLLRYLEHERQFNPNIAFMTPVFAESLLKGRRSARNYKFTVLAGDRVREQSFHDYETKFGIVLQLYGSTEMGAVAVSTPDLPGSLRQHSVGKAMHDVVLKLDEHGDLWCKRCCGFTEYIDYQGKPVQIREHVDKEWFHTKDRAVLLSPENYLEILGRTDHCVNRDGLLVSFSEIEAAIEKLTAIEHVIVVAHGESARGKKLIALYNTKPRTALTAEMIREHCFTLLSSRAVPDEIRYVSDFPLLPNGKIDRQQLITLL